MGNGDGHGPLGGSTGDGKLEFEAPDFFLYQPPGRDYIAFGHSLSSSDSYFGWSQNRYGWCTDYPENVQESSNARIAQKEFDISNLVGEVKSNSQVKPYKDYLTSVHRTQVLFAGGRGAIVRRFVASGTRDVISEDGGALKNIDLDIEAAAMGLDFLISRPHLLLNPCEVIEEYGHRSAH